MVHIEIDQFRDLFCCKTDDDGKTTQNESDEHQPEDGGKTDIDFGPEDLGVTAFKEVGKCFKKRSEKKVGQKKASKNDNPRLKRTGIGH